MAYPNWAELMGNPTPAAPRPFVPRPAATWSPRPWDITTIRPGAPKPVVPGAPRPYQPARPIGGQYGTTPTGNPEAWAPTANPEDDAAWAAKFQATYGRPPSEADWHYRWYSDVGIYGAPPAGAGGGGGATGGIPNAYNLGFQAVMGQAPGDYYKPTPAQQEADYNALRGIWEQATNQPVQDADWSRIWTLIGAVKRGRPDFTMGQAIGAVSNFLARPPQVNPVSMLNTSEV